MGFQVGEKYKHYSYKTPKGTALKKPVVKICTIVQDCERFVTVDFGKYRESISKTSLKLRDEWMEKVV